MFGMETEASRGLVFEVQGEDGGAVFPREGGRQEDGEGGGGGTASSRS